MVEEIWNFQIVMWLQNWSVTWLFWDPFMLSKHLVKFGVHRSCESGDIVLFATWPLGQCVTWLCGWSPLILSHHPAKFGVHRPYGTGNNGICNISSNSSSNSNSNSNAEVPMPRFTNCPCFIHLVTRVLFYTFYDNKDFT